MMSLGVVSGMQKKFKNFGSIPKKMYEAVDFFRFSHQNPSLPPLPDAPITSHVIHTSLNSQNSCSLLVDWPTKREVAWLSRPPRLLNACQKAKKKIRKKSLLVLALKSIGIYPQEENHWSPNFSHLKIFHFAQTRRPTTTKRLRARVSDSNGVGT